MNPGDCGRPHPQPFCVCSLCYSAQRRLDAMADAETLLRVAQSVYADSLHYDAASRRAALPILCLDAGRVQLFKTRHDRNRNRARARVAAAFRAVPALREDRP